MRQDSEFTRLEPRSSKSQDFAYTTVLSHQSALSGTKYYSAQCFMYPMKTVHRVQLFLDTFCQNGLQFRIICVCTA